ncbi:MAG: hypothetical protein HKN50_09175 [Gammaproteobacteria bacterium]|nr:hypothetical protein [Gammaproteobacteria bacterium]
MINFGAVDEHIFVGNAPYSDVDIARLHQLKVTAVLSLQSDTDLRNHEVDIDQLQQSYSGHDIVFQRFPIIDFDEQDLGDKLAQPVLALQRLLAVGHRVYVHCNAGICRAPATVLGYLCHNQGFDIESGLAHIRAVRPQANPYLRAVEKALQTLRNEPV